MTGIKVTGRGLAAMLTVTLNYIILVDQEGGAAATAYHCAGRRLQPQENRARAYDLVIDNGHKHLRAATSRREGACQHYSPALCM